jgi:hypothetical protein
MQRIQYRHTWLHLHLEVLHVWLFIDFRIETLDSDGYGAFKVIVGHVFITPR